ncbi:serine phosphatase RsbU (regulator of sigma subunit)/anti-sigma regulatory factor (Ser/Thr protein kinase) [Catenulispora sp. MAP12-49]|uniref:ATP-binding SpoIIE family protein phosphatase n=1 Tax=Catenulispora sp. MAP12-49 TaxID=3156302 RepID=UPI0035160A04
MDLRDHLKFLKEATEAIGTGVDMVAIARQFAAVLVPRLGDFASIHLLDALFVDGVPGPLSPHATAVSLMRRVAVAHDEPPGRWRAVVPEGAVQIMYATSPCHEAMATGLPVYVPSVAPARAEAMALSHGNRDVIPLVERRAYLAVPLTVRGRVLGCVAVTRRPERDPFDDADVLTIGQLASLVALSIDNVRLYRGQRATTAELQRAVSSSAPCGLTGAEVAHRYLPGNPEVEVGGDWFDTIALPGSRVGIVIGDVMGHGVRSAAAMGHLRIAVQTLAALDLPPDQLLRQLDNLAQRMGDDHLATCMYVVYDPIAGICQLANAGHLPPLIVRRGGGVEPVAIPSGAPIGVGGVAFDTVRIPISDGDTLLMYTDGLVEARGDDIGGRIEALAESLRLARPVTTDPEALCDALIGTMDPGRHEDDVAVLAARLTSIAASDVAHWLLSPRPAAVARSRRLIRQTLAGWSLTELRDIAELLVTELVTNAIRYATDPIELRLLHTSTLLCEVRDDDHYLPILLEAGDLDEHGRGLFLVSRLAQRWGASRTAHGKVVWFELAITDS